MKHDFGLHHNKTQAFIFYFDFLSCDIWQSSLTDSALLQDNVHAVFPMDNWSKLLLRVPQEPRWKEKHRALLHPNIYFEAIIKIIFTTWTLPLCLNNLDYPSINSKFPHSPRNYSMGNPTKSIFQMNKHKVKIFVFCKKLFLQLSQINVASVVPHPEIEPNCISSLFIELLMFMTSSRII